MDPLCSPQHRSERLIISGRVVLAAFFLLAVWLDPSEPAEYAQLAYLLLAVYLGYAMLLIPLAWTIYVFPNRLGVVTHVVDLIAFTLFMYFTEGPTSPFFLYFVFALLCAALRWQWRGTLWTTFATLTIFIGMGARIPSTFYTIQLLNSTASSCVVYSPCRSL